MKFFRHVHPMPLGKVTLAIGVFDGVHLGHQAVIRQAMKDAAEYQATPVVLTFDRHPNAIVAPARTPPLIYALPRRLKVIELLGIPHILVIEFDRPFSELSPAEFVRLLIANFGEIKSISVGANFLFGRERGGNLHTLRDLGSDFHFSVRGLPPVTWEGEPISSTRIRDCIRSAAFDRASKMLGRPYSLSGVVARGDRLGQKLGFPTANLDASGLVLPPRGVYAARAFLDASSFHSVVNIGCRPTVSNQALERVEAHLLGFSGAIYGTELELEFVGKIREEQRFPNLETLARQIQADIREAENLFARSSQSD